MSETTKRCTKCNTTKDLSEYHKKKANIDGYEHRCRSCRKEYNKMRYMKNKDEMVKKRNKVINENREEFRLQRREYYKKNKAKYKDHQVKYYNTVGGRETHNLKRAKRRALKISTADGSITRESLVRLMEQQNNKCYHCSCELGEDKHLDHYFPLSKGGTHSISNVVWSCPGCNLRKSATVPLTLF